MITNGTKFYKPTPAKLTGRDLMFAQDASDRAYNRSFELDIPVFDFTAPKERRPLMTRRIAAQYLNGSGDSASDYFDMGPFQITYRFSSAARKNNFPVKGALTFREYGASGVSFRALYEFLCETFNGDVLFIDTYFDKVFRTRPVYNRFAAIYDDIQDDINNEQFVLLQNLPLKSDGTPDMRFSASKRFMDFKVWQDPIKKQNCKRLASDIRHDIEVCLSTGELPLNGTKNPTVSEETKKLRGKLAGMVHPDRLFYASGQLIRHLHIFVEIGDKAA